MIRTSHLDALRERALPVVEASHVAGKDTRHSRAANLQAIRGMVGGEPHYTFGIKGIENWTFEDTLEAIASITKCSRDPSQFEGGGYISPRATLRTLEEGARRIAVVAHAGGSFLLGTGHPGSLLVYYVGLARVIRAWGGRVLEPERGAFVPPNLDLDYVGGLAVMSDRCSLMHTHDFRAMELMLEGAPRVDMVVADHGYAGAAINAKVPTVTIVDTNDPAPAVAKRMGADVVVIPMDDNRPLGAYLPLVDLIREFGDLAIGEAIEQPAKHPKKQAAGSPEKPSPEFETGAAGSAERKRARLLAEAAGAPSVPPALGDWTDRLDEAEKLVAERIGSPQPQVELVKSQLDSYIYQFAERLLRPGEGARLEGDPAFQLALAKHLLDSMRQAIVDRMRLAHGIRSGEEVVGYLNRCPTNEDMR